MPLGLCQIMTRIRSTKLYALSEMYPVSDTYGKALKLFVCSN